jgi:hypothetical protein
LCADAAGIQRSGYHGLAATLPRIGGISMFPPPDQFGSRGQYLRQSGVGGVQREPDTSVASKVFGPAALG